ncbi:hypothetical protein EEL30_19805 [Brevibacillus laterosporus]|uniref:Uncharacterized protein n=1 Tax=Brevibacillus laterosporus TaxID=1465 RepID=A0A518VBF7_BRELA|nr:hypothetical protein EEL30_19805 [Brevibacillus laterosporus]
MFNLQDLVELERLVEWEIKTRRKRSINYSNNSIFGKQLEEDSKKEILKYERLKVKINDLISEFSKE